MKKKALFPGLGCELDRRINYALVGMSSDPGFVEEQGKRIEVNCAPSCKGGAVLTKRFVDGEWGVSIQVYRDCVFGERDDNLSCGARART